MFGALCAILLIAGAAQAAGQMQAGVSRQMLASDTSATQIAGDVLAGAAILGVVAAGISMLAVTKRLNRDNDRLQAEIDERAKVEAKLHAAMEAERASDRRLAAIVENSDEAIISKTLGGIITSWNSAAERMFGYTAQEIIGQPLLTLVPPDRAEEESSILAGFLRGELVRHIETVRVRKGGERFYASATISPIKDLDGMIIGASKIVRDITARKQAELARDRAERELFDSRETLRGILDHVPQRVFWKDLDSVYLGCNQACAEDMGFSDASEVIGKTDYDGNWKHEGARYRADDRSVMELNATKTTFEEPGVGRDGQTRWLRTSKTPLHDQQGNVTGVLGTYEDITEHKLARLEIERLNADLEQRVALRTEYLSAITEEAERANRTKSEFLSRTSHELRTPLSAILGFAQLMEKDGNSPEDAENIGQILKAGRHLLDLVNKLLDISGLEAGKMPVNIRSMAAAEVIDEALEAVRSYAAECGVTLGALVCESRVLIDRQRFKQALLNLLFNAVKYNRQNGSVTLAGEERGGCLRLTITDTGPGIAPEDMGKLFNAFERLGLSNDAHGIGLGLTLSKRLMELMGGGIGVESVPGTGSTFWLEAPLAEQGMAVGPLAFLSPESAPSSCKTLLCIDDSAGDLRLITRILARRPVIRWFSARALEIGLEMAGESHPDLILLNLSSAESHCEEVMASLRSDSRTSQTPIAMISAAGSPEDRARILAAGVRAIVPKPVEVRMLLAALDQLLEIQPDTAH